MTVTDSQLASVVSAAKNTGVVTVDVSGLKSVGSAKIPAKLVKPLRKPPAPMALK